MKADEVMVVHGTCSNAFHKSPCLHKLVSAANLQDDPDPVCANSTQPGRESAKCPMYRDLLFPFQEQGCRLHTAIVTERERARFEVAHGAAGKSLKTAFGGQEGALRPMLNPQTIRCAYLDSTICPTGPSLKWRTRCSNCSYWASDTSPDFSPTDCDS